MAIPVDRTHRFVQGHHPLADPIWYVPLCKEANQKGANVLIQRKEPRQLQELHQARSFLPNLWDLFQGFGSGVYSVTKVQSPRLRGWTYGYAKL